MDGVIAAYQQADHGFSRILEHIEALEAQRNQLREMVFNLARHLDAVLSRTHDTLN